MQSSVVNPMMNSFHYVARVCLFLLATAQEDIPDLSQPLTEVAADCADAVQVAARRIRVDLGSTRPQAVDERAGQFYILQEQIVRDTTTT